MCDAVAQEQLADEAVTRLKAKIISNENRFELIEKLDIAMTFILRTKTDPE